MRTMASGRMGSDTGSCLTTRLPDRRRRRERRREPCVKASVSLCLISSVSTSPLPGIVDHVGLVPFAFVLGPSNFFAWALSVMFLVFTLRALLYKPFVRQIRTTRQMQELQPQIKALQKKYGKDRQRMALEMQKLQREHGFNPILGCLPMLAQIPVFLGLYHVLRSFNRTTGALVNHTCR